MYVSREERRKRMLAEHDPKIIENDKECMLIYGPSVSQILKNVLRDFLLLKKPLVKPFNKNNDIRPFEDATSIEFLSQKNDCSLFALGHHQKKRPHNLVIGRCFDFKILDMIEFGVSEYKEMVNSSKYSSSVGNKPCLLFQGDLFVNNSKFSTIQNILIDFFKGQVIQKVNILGLEHVIVFTALSEEKISMKRYLIQYSDDTSAQSAQQTIAPQVSLVDVGPSMILTIRRDRFASEDLKKRAMEVPAELKVSKARNKNVMVNPITKEREARIFVQQQPIHTIALRRFEAFKKDKKRKFGVFQEEDNKSAEIMQE